MGTAEGKLIFLAFGTSFCSQPVPCSPPSCEALHPHSDSFPPRKQKLLALDVRAFSIWFPVPLLGPRGHLPSPQKATCASCAVRHGGGLEMNRWRESAAHASLVLQTAGSSSPPRAPRARSWPADRWRALGVAVVFSDAQETGIP